MIIPHTMPEGHTIFCDDVRYEIGDKFSLIGVYNNYLVMDQMPGTIAQIHACVAFRNYVWADDEVVFRILFEDATTDAHVLLIEDRASFVPLEDAVPGDPAFENRYQEIRWNFRISPLTVTGPGRLKARAYIGDDEYRLGSLEIEGSTTEPPPSE